MGDKKPPPPTLGSIHPKYGERLASLNPSRDAIGAAVPKPAPVVSFKPNIVPRVPKKEPTKGDDIDSKLKGPMASLLDESTFAQQRINARFRAKPPARSGDSKTGVTGVKAPFMGGSSAGGLHKKERDEADYMELGDASSLKVKKHELEIDSSNPNHPSVLPFVDPQRQKELDVLRAKEKKDNTILAEIKQEIAMLEKEEEKIVPDVLVSTLDIPTPLMVDGDFLNEDNLFFIQLPSSLPFTLPPATDPNATTNTQTTNTHNQTTNTNAPSTSTNTNPSPAGAPPGGAAPLAPRKNPNEYVNTLRGVNGHLGKIVVYKSGKVKLKVGDVLYDVTAANNPNFLEELMVMEDLSCYRVGPMSQHLIVTPDIEDLLQKVDNL